MIQHIAFIMDGNRRWAKKQGLVAMMGHAQGIESVRRVTQFCLKKGISYLSLYAFSLENFKRSEEEKAYIFGLIVKEAEKGVDDFVQHGVRVRFMGDRACFPASAIESIQKIEDLTAHLNKLTVSFLFCYGGRQEIVAGAKIMAQRVQRGEMSVDAINEESFGKALWVGDMPDPDLIVRTGSEQRLSNFLLYQAAYSELMFLDCFWPEISDEDLDAVYAGFIARKRRFGS